MRTLRGGVKGGSSRAYCADPRKSPPDAAANSGQGALDQQLLDVRSALVDLAHADVAIDALERKIVDVAIAAQRLDRRAADALGHLAGEQLGPRGLLEAG